MNIRNGHVTLTLTHDNDIDIGHWYCHVAW